MRHPTFTNFFVFLLAISSAFGQTPACGITDSDGNIILPEDFAWPYAVPDHYEANTLIFKVGTRNVNQTFVTPHPHAVYLKALKYTTRYEIHTTASYFKFLEEQAPQTEIERASKFTCNGTGEEVTYNFRIPVYVSDMHEPQFHNGDTPFSFQITADWDPSVTVNQGEFIIVGDADEEFVNANLTFSLFPAQPLTAVGVPLWPEAGEPPKGHYYYRVDLFYRPATEGERLEEGVYEFSLIAASRMHSTDVKIVLTVQASEEGLR